MHSWVYRNRARLKLIYGSAPPPPPPALPSAEEAPSEVVDEAWEVLPEGSGEVDRSGEGVTLRPMPRRWA